MRAVFTKKLAKWVWFRYTKIAATLTLRSLMHEEKRKTCGLVRYSYTKRREIWRRAHLRNFLNTINALAIFIKSFQTNR